MDPVLNQAIYESVKQNDVNTLKMLLSRVDASNNMRNNYWERHSFLYTVFDLASTIRNISILTSLLETYTPITDDILNMMIIRFGDDKSLLKLLFGQKNFRSSMLRFIDTDPYGHPFNTDLHCVCFGPGRNLTFLKFLVESIPENDLDFIKMCIFIAINTEDIELLRIVLKHKGINSKTINTDEENHDPSSMKTEPNALDTATKKGNQTIIDLLIQHGAKTSVNGCNLISEVTRLRDDYNNLSEMVNKLQMQMNNSCNCSNVKPLNQESNATSGLVGSPGVSVFQYENIKLKQEVESLKQENESLRSKLRSVNELLSF